jgi:hypothetical protein
MIALRIERISWEDLWQALAMIGVICLATLIGLFIFADKKINYYYLISSTNSLKIVPDIDWAEDSSYGIELDRNITYADALSMVSRMNAELKENKQ